MRRLFALNATASTTADRLLFVTFTAGVMLFPVAVTTAPAAFDWKTLVNDFAPATTASAWPPPFVTLTAIVCVPGNGLASPHSSARVVVPFVAAPRNVIADAGPPASVPYVTLPTVAPPPFSLNDTLTITYAFFAVPTVWFHETATGFALDTVAAATDDAESKTT